MQTERNTMETLNLREAAAFLRVHPETLRARAQRNQIPGAKIGRSWVFLREDLVKVIRAVYAEGGQMARVEDQECHSTSAKTRRFGGFGSKYRAIQQYRRALGLPTE